jgi:ERCC4-related helicase
VTQVLLYDSIEQDSQEVDGVSLILQDYGVKAQKRRFMTTPYHAKYFAHELTRQHQPGGVERLSMALFDACVDLNPHQIEAALFALRSPLSKGVVLADEVGLGKTIEAGLVLCQYWAERKRKLLVICPASLRKQWSLELTEKFNLPNLILDTRSYLQAKRDGNPQPFSTDAVVITSFKFASRMRGEVCAVSYDLVVVDEAHKLRNAYRPSNKMGQNLKWVLEDRKKCLLTATPLQNSLLELYGLSTILDDLIFADVTSFRSQYANSDSDLKALRTRLQAFCRRTLRRQVVEYIQFTERRPIIVRFRPTDDEQQLYQAVSDFLKREDTISVPHRQRHLVALILRKLLASSSHAIANTLETMKSRLEALQQGRAQDNDLMEELVEGEELEDEYLDEMLAETTDEGEDQGETDAEGDRQSVNAEIAELTRYAQWARSIGIDTKSRALLKALELGFAEMQKMGANRKALVFTESRRTQDYLKCFLEANGYGGQIVHFNGTNADPESRRILDRWIADNAATGRVTGSRPVDSRTALIEYFRDHAPVMIATEAAAEGVNMQFCSLVVNYDLPWNPHRIEQRIGRCHRYGQKHDVVVINFLNERNEADRRVQELLAEKFNLFSGVFGASDEVLGQIESGVDFEKRILAIYQQCRTTGEIDAAFKQLQQEMDETIRSKLDDTRRLLLEHFDEDVHARLKMRLDDAHANLDRIGRLFWTLTRFVLRDRASFDDQTMTFHLHQPPLDTVRPGRYHVISKAQSNVTGDFLYRLSHPLGEWVIETGKQSAAPIAQVVFDVTNYPAKVAVVEALKGKTGWLTLQHLLVESFDREEYLLFSAMDDAGKSLDQETCERLFLCAGAVAVCNDIRPELAERLRKEAARHAEATVARSLEMNNQLFNEERERLEKWAEDMVIAAEKDLEDTKTQIKAVRRHSRLATTLDEQHTLQQKLRELERKQRRQRQHIFDLEDEIADKRDALIDGLQKRMSQKTTSTPLFTVRWAVV